MSDLSQSNLLSCDDKKYVFYLQTSQSKIIKVLFEVLKEVLMGAVNLFFEKKGITLKTLNGTKKSIVYLNLESEEFDQYFCNEDRFIAGIDTTNLHKITKTIQSKDYIKMYVEYNNKGVLIFERINPETKSLYSHKIKLCNVPISNLNIGNTIYNHSLSLKSLEFQIACKNLNGLNCDNISLYFKQNSIILSGSNDYSDNEIEIKQQQDDVKDFPSESNDEQNILFDGPNDIKKQGTYLLQYILLFTKATALDKNFDIYLNPEKPLTLSYSVGNLGHLDFMLEPALDDETDYSSDEEDE